MKSMLSFYNYFIRNLILAINILLLFPVLMQGQNRITKPFGNKHSPQYVNAQAAGITNKTTASTCPTAVVLGAQDSTNYVNGTATTIASGGTVACGNQSIIISPTNGSTTNENTPCINTEYLIYYTNIRNNITETFYEGGQNIGCIGPNGCYFPIGGTNPALLISGLSTWSLYFGYLDPTFSHDFTFCRTGNNSISTTTVTLKDCWSGATLAGPNVLSNGTVGSNSVTATCFTMTIPANTPIGSAAYSISPASASSSLVNYGDGEAQVKTYQLPSGTYTVNYTFTPPPSSGCAPVNGTYKFTVGPNPTVNVTSPTVCSGTTPTITASGTSTSYSWTPSTNLSSSTGSAVSYSGASSTTITVTGFKGGCSAMATSTVTINPTPTVTVNSPTICSGATATLTASGANTFSWSPGVTPTTGIVVTVTPSSSAVYTVTGTSLSCTASATASVTIIPASTITATSATVCTGGTGTLTASGAVTFTWTPATGLNTTTGATVQANPPSTQVYTITGSDGTCAAIAGTATLTVSSVGSLITSNDTTICAGGSAVLTASGANSYSWTPSTGLTATTGSAVTASPLIPTSYTVTGITGSCSSVGVINVGVNAVPTLTATSASVCAGDSATLTVSGATSYTWNPSTSLNLNSTGDTAKSGSLVAITYTITGTTGVCSATTTASVNIITAPTVTVSASSNMVCANGSTTLTATGASSYTWSPGSTLSATTGSVVVASPTVNPTTYTVSGSIGSCAAVPATITISISPTPIIATSNDTTTCAGGTAILTASGATTYTWVNSTSSVIATTATVAVTPTVTQTYYVIGTTNSCLGLDSVKVTVNPLPTFTVSNSGTICAGQQTATLTATSGTVALTYSWTPSSGLSASTGSVVIANPSTTTPYNVTGTDAVTGCSNTGNTTVTVNQPAIISVPQATVCIGNTATLTATGALTYSWSPSTNLNSATGSTVLSTPTSTNPSTYTIVSTDANGCFSTATTTVTVNNLPVVIISTTGAVCVNSTATLTAIGAVTYTWSPATNLSSVNGTPVTITPTTTLAPTYTVTGSDANGCVNTATTSITINPRPTVVVIPPTSTICKNNPVNLTASGADTYIWTPATGLSATNISNPTATVTVTTNYTVIGTYTATGCKSLPAIASITVLPIKAVISANPQTGEAPLTVTFSNGSTGGTSYNWNYGNGQTQVTASIGATTMATYTNAGTYTATLVAENAAGCRDIDSIIIIVNEGYAISIPNIFTPNGDNINDNFFVKSSGVTSMSIIILDRWGLKMWESSSLTASWDGRNGSKDANDGTYFYIISATDNKGVTTSYKGYLTLLR